MLDKTAIVTGASSGIGLELVKMLVEQGTKVACCARNIDTLEALCSENKLNESNFYVKSVDVKNEAEIISFTTEANEKLGKADFLFNNVGMNSAKAEVTEIDTNDFDDMYAVNMRAPMIFTREVAAQMKSRKRGCIINTHSSCCLFSNASIGSYTASKSGFDALTKVFRKELRDDNIKVLNVYPGGVDTPFRTLDRPDYLHPKNVALAIMQQLHLPQEIYMDDIVLRPNVERNF